MGSRSAGSGTFSTRTSPAPYIKVARMKISAYTAEPGSASQNALNLLASWVATLEAAGSASDQPGQAR